MPITGAKIRSGLAKLPCLRFNTFNASDVPLASGNLNCVIVTSTGVQWKTQYFSGDPGNTSRGFLNSANQIVYDDLSAYTYFDVYLVNLASLPALPVGNITSNASYIHQSRIDNDFHQKTVAMPTIDFEILENPQSVNLTLTRVTSGGTEQQQEQNNIKWELRDTAARASGFMYLTAYSQRPTMPASGALPTTNKIRDAGVMSPVVNNFQHLFVGTVHTSEQRNLSAIGLTSGVLSQGGSFCSVENGWIYCIAEYNTLPTIVWRVLFRYRVRVNVAPTIYVSYFESERSNAEQIVSEVAPDDVNFFDTVSIALTAQTPGNYFSLVGTDLTMSANTPPNDYSLTFEANDGKVIVSRTITFTVNGLPDEPLPTLDLFEVSNRTVTLRWGRQ